MKNVLGVAGIFGVSIVSVSSDLRILHQQSYRQSFHREAFCLLGASRGATLVAPGLIPSATSPLCRFKTRQIALFQKKNAEEEDQTPNPDETGASIVEQTTSVLSTPIFEGTLNRPLALGYPLALLLGTLILPFSTSVLFAIGFGAFAWIGRSAIDQDEDEENDEGEVSLSSDFLALVAAGLTAGILAPLSESVVPSVSIDNDPLYFVVVGALIVLALPSITNSTSSIGPTSIQDFIDKDDDDDELSISANEKRMMRLWDQAFSKVTTVRVSKKDEADK